LSASPGLFTGRLTGGPVNLWALWTRDEGERARGVGPAERGLANRKSTVSVKGNGIRGPSHCPSRVMQILRRLSELQVAFVLKASGFSNRKVLAGPSWTWGKLE